MKATNRMGIRRGSVGLMLALCAGGSLGLMYGCSASAKSDSGDYDDEWDGSGTGGSAAGDGDASLGPDDDAGDVGFGGAGSDPILPDLPEEVEDDTQYRVPVVTGKYLWSANPTSGRVALVDVEDLTTRVLPAGLYPTYLTSVGTDEEPAALVLNTGSHDVTRFRVQPGGNVARDAVKTHQGANRWATSKDGAWAVAFSRPESGQTLDVIEGLQELTVIRLSDEGMKATRLTVGYRPSQVKISSDGERLIVVSEDGITLIELSDSPQQYDWIDLGLSSEVRDVSINEAGTYAIVRRPDESTIELIDLADPSVSHQVTFSGPVTDLDLAENGRALAVIRSKSEVATFLLDDVISDPSDFDTLKVQGEVIGSAVLTEDGGTAVLYTNAIENERVSVVDLREDSFLAVRSISTKAPVYSVVASPDGKHAVIVAGQTTPLLGEVGIPAEAFSVVALREERFPRVVGTGAPVGAIGLGNSYGIVTATSDSKDVHEAHLLQLPSLSVRREPLSTRPLAAGILSGLSQAYAAQAHPDGRVTFFDLKTDQARTLTGFELSAEVVDE